MIKIALKNTADTTAGVAGHMHYDPYFPRLLAHVKRLLAENLPVLIRLHPGSAYPMPEDTLHYRVDREGHVVALIGYDDEKQHFIVADPWNQEAWKGDRGGFTTLPYEHAMICMVDSSLGAIMLLAPWQVEASMPAVMPLDQPFTFEAHVNYTCPEPISAAENHVSECKAVLELPAGLELAEGEVSQHVVGNGFFKPGDTNTMRWTLVRKGNVDGAIRVRVRGLITNNDPYLYTDILGIAGLVHVKVNNNAGTYQTSIPTSVTTTASK